MAGVWGRSAFSNSRCAVLVAADWAEEVRLQAEEMIYPNLRREMLKIADGYERLAKHVEERTAGKRSRA